MGRSILFFSAVFRSEAFFFSFFFFFFFFFRPFGPAGLTRGSRKSVVDLSSVPDNSHRFSTSELEWLGAFWSSQFGGRAPPFSELSRAFPSMGDHERLFLQLFRVLDRNRNGALDFEEFVHGCSVAGRGSLDQKLGFLFILFDSDEDRIVSQADLREMVALIGRFMIRDSRLAARTYAREVALEMFHGAETLLLDRFKQRAISNVVADNCVRFFDAVFFPVLQVMESDLRSAQLFNRPLPYILLREGTFVPSLLVMAAKRISEKAASAAPVDVHALFGRRIDDEECVRVAARVEAAWIDLHFESLFRDDDDVSVVAAVMKKFLNELPEPLFPFVLYGDVIALEGATSKKLTAGMENVVRQLPPIHLAALRVVVSLVKKLATRSSGRVSASECEKLCVALAPLVVRSKNVVDDDKEVRVKSAVIVGRGLAVVVMENLLAALDAEQASLFDAEKKLDEVRKELAASREECQAMKAQVTLSRSESEAAAEKLAQQTDATVKMSQRLAELRQELTTAKLEMIALTQNHSPRSEKSISPRLERTSPRQEKSVAKAVGEWLAGPEAVQGDSDAMEVIAKHEMREKEWQRRRTNQNSAGHVAGKSDSYDKVFEGAQDGVTVTVELFRARGLINKDGKCDAYPKVGLRLIEEEKVVRKKVGASSQIQSVNPIWNSKFSFVVSQSRLAEVVLQVTVHQADKFGRDAFLGIVHLPLNDIAGQNVEDWFPFKQRKPTDKVSGEVHMRVTNSAHGAVSPKAADAFRVELYSAKGAQSPPATRVLHSPSALMDLTASCTTGELQKLYEPDPPNSPQYIVFDQILKTNLLALSRTKFFTLLASQSRAAKDPEFLIDSLLTIETWTSPEHFLRSLFARYVGPPSDAVFEMAEFELQQRTFQAGVVKVLNEWTSNPLVCQDFFRTFGLREMLLQFCQEQNVSHRLFNLTKQAEVQGRGRSGSVINLMGGGAGTRSRREESVFELPVNNVSEQLTLIEFQLLSEIRLSELCGQAWNKEGKEERAKNVLAYISWFNRVSRWVATQIIQQAEALGRAAAIAKFIEIGGVLCGLNNFNGVIEILSALHSSAIARLKETWALVPKETMAQLEELDMLMNTDGNFRHYRMLLEKSKPPVVPYMGLLLTDLTFMDDANLTEVSPSSGDGNPIARKQQAATDKLLNFEKIRMLAGVYKLFRRCISRSYPLAEMRSVHKLLQNIGGFDDNELYRLSKLREVGAGAGGASSVAAAPSASVLGDSRKQRKLISQITSSMLTRSNLDISDDSMGKADWDRLLTMDGVVMTTRRLGDTLFLQGGNGSFLYRVKTGRVVLKVDDGWTSSPQEIMGVMFVLNPFKKTPFTAEVVSDLCEVCAIPLQVVHVFTADLDMSRKLYGTLAQNQVELLLEMNAVTPKASKKLSSAMPGPGAVLYEVSWIAKTGNQSRDFEFSGTMNVTQFIVSLSSKMLGFLNYESIFLTQISSCVVQGNAGCIVYRNLKNEEVRQMFKCLSGFAETEAAVECISMAVEDRKLRPEEDDPPRDDSNERAFLSDPMALTRQDWDALTQGAKKVVVKKDEVVMKEGESYQRMYQILRGVIRVEKKMGDESKVLGRLRASETFGEMSFLTGSAATASCFADSDEVELVIMEGYYLNMLFRIRPEICGRFYKFLSMLVTARILTKVT